MYSTHFVQLKLGEIDQFLARDIAGLSLIRTLTDLSGLERAGGSTKRNPKGIRKESERNPKGIRKESERKKNETG